MINYIVKAPKAIAKLLENKEFCFDGYLNREYCLRMTLSDENVEFPECRVRLINFADDKLFYNLNFIEKSIIRIKIDEITAIHGDLCRIKFFHDFPNMDNSPTNVEIDILEIRTDLIELLNISNENKKLLFEMIDFYLKSDFKSVLNIICILSEYIARELAQKAMKVKFKDFGSAINALVHVKKKRRTKFNYIYMGSLLYPIYYIRNQKLHPYHRIEFNESKARIVLYNISEVFEHLIEKNIKLI